MIATTHAVREKGVIFSAPMVKALFAGTKTQTRRVLKLPNGGTFSHVDPGGTIWGPGPYVKYRRVVDGDELVNRCHCPYGYPGDRLWVRETWAPHDPAMLPNKTYYAADHPEWRTGEDIDRWRPSIHMPRSRSRITLEIADVRVQRLQDISEEDARAEGVTTPLRWHPAHVLAFSALWDEIHGDGAWDANPYVWALTFKRAEVPRGA